MFARITAGTTNVAYVIARPSWRRSTACRRTSALEDNNTHRSTCLHSNFVRAVHLVSDLYKVCFIVGDVCMYVCMSVCVFVYVCMRKFVFLFC